MVIFVLLLDHGSGFMEMILTVWIRICNTACPPPFLHWGNLNCPPAAGHCGVISSTLNYPYYTGTPAGPGQYAQQTLSSGHNHPQSHHPVTLGDHHSPFMPAASSTVVTSTGAMVTPTRPVHSLTSSSAGVMPVQQQQQQNHLPMSSLLPGDNMSAAAGAGSAASANGLSQHPHRNPGTGNVSSCNGRGVSYCNFFVAASQLAGFLPATPTGPTPVRIRINFLDPKEISDHIWTLVFNFFLLLLKRKEKKS